MSRLLVLENSGNILSLLKDDDQRLKANALKKLSKNLNLYWHEIADHLADMYTYFI